MSLFTEQSNYLIIGKKRSGKTALGWYVTEAINKVQNKEVYTFRHPRPELLKKIPFKVENITNFDRLFNISNAVILIDEAHKHFNILNKMIDEKLKNLLGDSGQNNLDVIFICHNSYFVNRSLFTFLDVKMIKEVVEGHWEMERPHMKKLYHNHPIHKPEWYFIDSDWKRGKCSFQKPGWYNDELSKAYSVNNSPDDPIKEAIENTGKCGAGRSKTKVRTGAVR